MQDTRWDHALKVTGGGTGLVGHAGAILLRKAADQAGLTAALSAALRKAGTSPLLDRGIVLVSMAAAIALGATSMSDIAVLAHLAPVLGDAPSGPTIRRALDLAGTPAMLDRIARARARARAHVWSADRAARPPGSRGWPSPGRPWPGGWSSTWTPPWSPPARTRRERLRPGRKATASTRWAPGAPIPASAWPCCCAPATPGQTPSLTTGTCWPRRSGRSRPGSGPGSWSASTGPGRAMNWSSTCCRCPPRAGRSCSPAAG